MDKTTLHEGQEDFRSLEDFGSLGTEEALVNPEVQYEASDASVRWVLVFAGSLVVLGAVVFVSLLWFFWFMLAREPAAKPSPSVLAAQERGQLPPEPRLEGLVSYDKLYGIPEAEKPAAPKYGWVDRQQSIVSIPVEEAMDIQTRILSAKKPGPPGRTWQSEPQSPSSSNSGRTLGGGQTILPAPGGQP